MAPDRFEVLIEAARQGSDAAWAEIFGDLAPVVLGYLRGSGIPDPEDVLGETFLQVARDVARFNGDWAGFRAWVFAVAHHRLIDARRRDTRRPVVLMPEPSESAAVSADIAEDSLARIGADEIKKVLGLLPDDQRAVLLLRVLGDLSIKQVAEVLGKRPGAIKQLQRRGLLAAREHLEQQGVTP